MNRLTSVITALSLVLIISACSGCLKRSKVNQENPTVAEVIETAQVVPANELSAAKF